MNCIFQVHQLFFWGSSYPCTETDRYNRCQYVKDFMMDESENTPKNMDHGMTKSRVSHGIHTKQGPRASDSYESYRKPVVRRTTGNTHESVHGAGNDLYAKQFPAQRRKNSHRQPTIPLGDAHGLYGYDNTKPTIHRKLNPLPHSSSRGQARPPRKETRPPHRETRPPRPYAQRERPQYAPPNRVDYDKTKPLMPFVIKETTLQTPVETEYADIQTTTQSIAENTLNTTETTEPITSSTVTTSTHAPVTSTTSESPSTNETVTG